MRSKKSKGFSGRNRKFKRFFQPKTDDLQKKEIARDFPAEIGNSSGFSGQKQVISQKKRSSLKLQGIFRPKSEIQAVFPAKKKVFIPKTSQNLVSVHKNTDLDLDLRSRSPEPVNFFGAQSSLGGNKQSVGGHGHGMPPVAPGLGQSKEILIFIAIFTGTAVRWH